MLHIHDLSYVHPNRDLLFSNISLHINRQDKVALIGNNGAGKSTLLKIIAGELAPTTGTVQAECPPYYLPQIFGQFNDCTVAQVLKVDKKLNALQEILAGKVTEANMGLLEDDWTIEERCREAFVQWQLEDVLPGQKMKGLSGGQKTRVCLAGIMIHRAELVLLDEPSNHLDSEGRKLLYEYVQTTKHTLVMVSHDRALLHLPDTTYELSGNGLRAYGGNYRFYEEQKAIEVNALEQDLRSKEKAYRKARETARETIERQQKLDARGKKKQEKSGLPTIAMNTLRNQAEKSTARTRDVHADKMNAISEELNQLRKDVPDADRMKMNLDSSGLHKGKVLVTAKDLNFGYDGSLLWQEHLDFEIRSGERIALKGLNGSGKTSLLKIILGRLQPLCGSMAAAGVKTIYIDQDYAIVDNELRVYEQTQRFNTGALQEHEVKIRLNRFLFTKADWDKPCAALSGGEKMRLILCCLTIDKQAPDMIVLDEPTNNLDLRNIEILTTAINEYQGTVLVVSHDEYFLKEINVGREIYLE